MNELVVYGGEKTIDLKTSGDPVFLYRVGSGCVAGSELIDVNDARRLNRIAEEIREAYCKWIFSFNEYFKEANLVEGDLSLFFLTDLSCKRTELFDTFQTICNILLIVEITSKNDIRKITLEEVDQFFARALQSRLGQVDFRCRNIRRSQKRRVRWIAKDLLFLCEVLIFSVRFGRRKKCGFAASRTPERLYFSPFPKMMARSGPDMFDKKYGKLTEKLYLNLVSVLTDGLHQRVPVWRHGSMVDAAEQAGMVVVDRFLQPFDVLLGLKYLIRTRLAELRIRKRNHEFKGICVSAYIEVEMIQSMGRVVRLVTVAESYKRLAQAIQVPEFVYYLHEYPFGRMLSWVFASHSKSTRRVGFQHGPSSWRKLLYFLAPGEGAVQGPFQERAPLPDAVLAEDAASADIYRHAGYANVAVMSEVSRLKYLDGIHPQKNQDLALIAPGLHDGATLIREMSETIRSNPEKTFLIRPHPLANRDYLEEIVSVDNVEITLLSIEELLGSVSEVYATYSSVAVEAKVIGLDVHLVNLPGVVSQSPLADIDTDFCLERVPNRH